MMFRHGRGLFKIEFSRAKEKVKTFKDGKEYTSLSKHPFTTVEVRELLADKKHITIAKATVGCVPGDPFTLEGGRLKALKKATFDVPREMRKAMWDAYHARTIIKDLPTPPPAPAPDDFGPSVPAKLLMAPPKGVPFSYLVH